MKDFLLRFLGFLTILLLMVFLLGIMTVALFVP